MRARVETALRTWLTLQCRTLGARAGLALWTGGGTGAAMVHWPPQQGPDARLSATVAAARERQRPVVQSSGAVGDGDASRTTLYLARPIEHEGRGAGAVGVCLQSMPPADVKRIQEALGAGVALLSGWLEAEGGRERLAARLALAGCLLDGEHPSQAAHAFAAELARRVGAERVTVGLRRGDRLRVAALSTSARFNDASDLVSDLRAALEEATDQDVRIDHPAPEGAAPLTREAHARLLRETGAGAVSTVPLAARGRGVGALTAEWASPGAAEPDALEDAAVLAGPVLQLLERADAGPFARARREAGAFAERHLGDDRSLLKGFAATVAALLLFVTFYPAQYRVSARATLEGRVQRALVAGVAGYLSEANARAGDLVREGDVLARLDQRDLALERRRRESERAQLENEYREALASGDRVQVSLLRARIEQAQAQLDLAEEQLARTSVVAPFDAVILEGDLAASVGSPVELGSVLFEVAPLDGYRTVLEVDGRDIAEIEPGQEGKLALSALPGETLPLRVERITPMSTTEDGRHYFRVEADLVEPLDALRPGMEGFGKIEVGRRRLLWIWTHGLLDWLRLRTWTWLP